MAGWNFHEIRYGDRSSHEFRDAAMVKQKSGELRILKGDVVYGPMSRGELERLLSESRFVPSDQVSVLGAPWTTIAQYLAPPPLDQQPIPERCLRVLKGMRMFPPLSRQEVVELAAQGRIGDDDLVRALEGPWMRLADFFAPPPAARSPEPEDDKAVLVQTLPAHAVAVGRLRVADLLEPERQWPDEWYAKVRGLYTLPMQKRHIRLLYQSGELTLDCPVRNAAWRQSDWRRIRDVPEVYAEATRI